MKYPLLAAARHYGHVLAGLDVITFGGARELRNPIGTAFIMGPPTHSSEDVLDSLSTLLLEAVAEEGRDGGEVWYKGATMEDHENVEDCR